MSRPSPDARRLGVLTLTLAAVLLVSCGDGAVGTEDDDAESVLILDRGPHTESETSPSETTPRDSPSDGATAGSEDTQTAAEQFTLEELQEMPYEQFRSGEVSREERYQLLWHYAQLSAEYAEHFSPEEDLDAHNPAEVAAASNAPEEILQQHWYLDQLYRLGELLADDHGGRDIAMKLARVVDRGNVRELESMLGSADTDPPAWLLESRYTLEDADRCLEPPEGTNTSIPWEEQTCWDLEFSISRGEATSLMPYFHWTEFETAEGEPAGFWNRSALHWL